MSIRRCANVPHAHCGYLRSLRNALKFHVNHRAQGHDWYIYRPLQQEALECLENNDAAKAVHLLATLRNLGMRSG